MFTMFTLPSSTSTNTLLMLICCPVRPIVIDSKFYISFHFWDLLLNISPKSNRISRMIKDCEWPSYRDKYNEKPQFQQKIIKYRWTATTCWLISSTISCTIVGCTFQFYLFIGSIFHIIVPYSRLLLYGTLLLTGLH